MVPRTISFHLLGLALLIMLPVSVLAHQISLIRAEAVVHRDKLDITFRVLPEDVLLSAGSVSFMAGRVAKADILKGAETHPKVLLDGLTILDEDGRRLTGQVTGVDLPTITGDSIPVDVLLSTTVVYRVEYPLAKPPARLGFWQHFNTATSPMPVMTVLTVTREGLNSSTMMQVPDGANPETVAFDWTETATSSTGTVTTVTQLASFDVTDTYLYIQNEEVRVEILMPLATLETWFPIKRANPEILEPLEQVVIRTDLEKFLTGQNELKIDGLVVKPRLERYDFYGLDYRDFSVRPERKRLNAASTRLGAILTYSTKGAPRHVELTWTLFNSREPTVRAVVFAYDKGSRLLFQPDKPTFVWDNPGVPPLPKIETVSIRQNAADDSTRAALSEALLRNVYRGFDYRSETDIYEALAQSVRGELLTDLYLKIKQGLIMQEQGGAVARVKEVTVTKSEPASGQIKGGFVERVTWQVEGTVEHWGHIHTRVNEYTADLGITPSHGAWKINSMDVVKQSQVKSAVSIRRL
jgi:hypothetical protein